MKPDVRRALEVCAAKLMGEVAPHVTPSYRQATVLAAGMLLVNVNEEIDRIADRRVRENAAMRAVFRDAAPVVADPSLRERVEEAAAGAEAGYRISELDATNAALRALLIDLHAHVEAQDGEEARRVEAGIWRELAASTERRRHSLDSF